MKGYVNFPTTDPRYKDTVEGGMIVMIVVWEKDGTDWREAAAGQVVIPMGAEYLCDHNRPVPKHEATWEQYSVARAAYDEFHYPRLHNHEASIFEQFLSRPYLATINLGDTPWSGWDEDAKAYWSCGINDLTAEGRQLLELITRLYHGCDWAIQTWLDT